jgi:hypothetical protein
MSMDRRETARMLTSYSRRALETWAKARGLDPQRFRGPQLQGELARVLLAPASLKTALAGATTDEQTILARLKLEGGVLLAEELKAQLLIDGVKEPDAAFTALMSRGLIFFDRSFDGYGRWELWGGTQQPFSPSLWLPDEVAELVTIPDDLGHRPLESAAAPPQIREAAYATLRRDIYLLLQALRENPIKLLKSGDVSKRDSERLLKILPTTGAGENDPTAKARAGGAWFSFLWLLIQRAGLVAEEPGKMTASEAGLQFLGQSEAQQAHLLLRAWVNLLEWDEFRRVPSLAFEAAGFGDFPSPPQLVMARAALMELLMRQRPYPGWYSITSLLASMYRFRVAFLIPRSDMMTFFPWQVNRTRGERHYRGFHARGSSPPRHFHKDKDWELVEGAYLRTLLEEPLLWLGIIRLGYAGDQLVSFELTERGAAAVGLIEMPAPASSPSPREVAEGRGEGRALVVQPNFEVVVYPEIGGVPLLVELDRFAERVRMDRAALYRLTRADLCRGLQGGLTLAEITRTLELHNAGPLPQNVAYTLAEWEQLYQRIHVQRRVSLIEAADDAELRALRRLPELAKAREIAPRVLLVPADVLPRNLRLKPEVIDYTAPITNAIEFETTTRLRVLPGMLTPRLRHRLLQVADPVGEPGRSSKTASTASGPSPSAVDGEGWPKAGVRHQRDTSQFELSREKVVQAARWWPWEAMLAFLTGAARKKPGADLAVTLKGWAGGLPPAALTAVTILAAPSASWLDEVMLVPEVKPLILRRLSPTLALVSEENRARLDAALAAIGVTTGADVSLGDLLSAATRAEAEAGEVLLIGPPRKRRALIEQAIAEKRRVSIAMMPYTGKLTQSKMDPVRIEGEGAGAYLVARVEGLRYEQQYALNRIQGVRMLDEPTKS